MNYTKLFFNDYLQQNPKHKSSMKKAFIPILLTCLFASCGNKLESETIEFETYIQEQTAETPDGAPAGMLIKIDIPIGDGTAQKNINETIKGIVAKSELANEIGAPIEGSLKEIVNDYAVRFINGIRSDSLPGACEYDLTIEHRYQNSQCVVLHITDGVFGNGGPQERDIILSIPEGNIEDGEDIISISNEEIWKMLEPYASNEQKEQSELVEAYWFSPDSVGCRVLMAIGSHFFESVTLPAEKVAPYLTEKGRKLFEVADVHDVAQAPEIKESGEEEKAEEEAPKAQPGQGELGIFDLRGPVKKCVWGDNTYTFDEKGFWLTQNGRSLKSIFPGGVERDHSGRISYGNADAYGSIGYVFNSQGLATEINEDGFSRELSYDADGYVCKEKQTLEPEMGDEEGEAEVKTYTYTIIEKDEMGNWTKRKSAAGTETRVITYY